MPDLSGRELIREWRKLMDSIVDAMSTVTARSEIPSQVREPLQRQLELVQELIERERRLQEEIAEQVLAPVDVAFDLLEQVARRCEGRPPRSRPPATPFARPRP